MKYWPSVSFLLLCQCAGTETGNPVVRTEALIAFAPVSATVARQGFGEISFERVSIRVASLSLESCADRATTVLFQDRSLDLFADEMQEIRIPAGTYCALVVGMGGTNAFSAGRQVSQGKTRLSFDSQLRASTRMQLVEPVVVGDAQPSWVLGVDLSQWLDPIDAWLNSGDARLSINDAETQALRSAQARSLRLYEDLDGNGRLDESDLDAPLSDVGMLQR